MGRLGAQGDVITYTLAAVNDGNVTLKDVAISDPSLPTLTCAQPVDLAPGETLTCTGTHMVTQADVDTGSVHNTATAAGTDPNDATVSGGADEQVPLAQAPHLTLIKVGTLDDQGDAVHYTLTAVNDGNVTLRNVSISDPSLPTLACDQPVDLAPGEKLTCTGTHTLSQGEINSGSVANTGTVTGSDPNGNDVPGRADEQVPLDQEPHLSLTKDGSLDTGTDGLRRRARAPRSSSTSDAAPGPAGRPHRRGRRARCPRGRCPWPSPCWRRCRR